MSFAGIQAKLCLILRIDIDGHPIRLSEAAEVEYGGDIYRPDDDVFGTIISFEDFSEGEADEAPSFDLTWALKDADAAVTFSNPSNQGAFVRWLCLSIDRATNAVLDEHVIFTGILDSTSITLTENQYYMKMSFTTDIDRILNTDKGNKLNRSFHRSVWSGETGLDFMTGTTIPVPWGDKDQARVSSGGGGGGGVSTPGIRFR